MKKSYAIVCSAILLFVLVQAGIGSSLQTDQKDSPEKLIKITRFLEQKPFDKNAKDARSWAIKWLIVTDKVSVKLCYSLFSGISKEYKYGSQLFAQYTMGVAAYKLDKPLTAQDEDSAQQAGIESALTSYEAMLTEEPKAKNAFMDDLLAKRGRGVLAVYVKENNCQAKK